MLLHMNIYTYVYTYIYTSICIYIYVRMHICDICSHIFIHTYLQIHPQIHIPAHVSLPYHHYFIFLPSTPLGIYSTNQLSGSDNSFKKTLCFMDNCPQDLLLSVFLSSLTNQLFGVGCGLLTATSL